MKIVLGWEKHTVYIFINIKRSDSKMAIKQFVYFPVAGCGSLSLISVTPWSLLALSCLSAEQEASR